MPHNSEWIAKLERFCTRYDLNIEHLSDVLNDQKVIPMIRGKSFEYTVSDRLSQILPSNYQIANPTMNAQAGIHDVDVEIKDTLRNKVYRVECKLSAKGSFRENSHSPYLKVKCMRSRTLGARAAEQLSRSINIPSDILQVHNDQYRPENFDIVITTIGNAFYSTDSEGFYYWDPPEEALEFLQKIGTMTQQEAFNKMYAARSYSISSNEKNNVACTRRACRNKNCNFIPNYPLIYFDSETGNSLKPWVPIEEIETILK